MFAVEFPNATGTAMQTAAVFEDEADALAYAQDEYEADKNGRIALVHATDDAFWVDLPNAHYPDFPEPVQDFAKYRDAVAFAVKHYGADGRGRISIVVEY